MTLVEGFAHPDAFGPVPIWWWSGAALDPARLRWQMEQLIAGGVRQAVVLNLAPSGPLYGALADSPEFFTKAWWDVFTEVCRDAQQLGFGLWFYDQLGFSGADLQGRLLRTDPSHRGRVLDRVELEVDGPAVLVAPEGMEALAGFAVPTVGTAVHVPLTDGALVWEGTGRLVLAVSQPHGFDYLSASACAALRDVVHGEFDRRVGHLFGSVVVGSFQDELPSMPSWSADFLEQFHKRRGYALDEHLLHLWEDLDEQTPHVRADYQRTRADLAEEAFFRPLHEWHEARGLLVGCDQQHPARAGYPLEATQQYADYLRTHRWFSAPGSDHWGDATVHSSLAHLYDRPRTWVEAFHSTGWGGTLEETLDWLLPWLRAGANLYDPHAVYYDLPGGSWDWAPPSTCWRQPYWRHHKVFADTVARLCAALTWGDHACDIAVLFPTTTAQSELELDRPEQLLGSDRGTSQAQDTYLDVVGTMHWYEPRPGVLDRAGWDLDVLDDDSLVRGEVRDGRLVIGGESYGAVVLPGCSQVEDDSLHALAAFAAGGGTVVVIGEGPDIPGARRCASAAELPDRLQHLPRRVEASVPTLLRVEGTNAVLLVLAGTATAQPEGRRWREEGISFDPTRYAAQTTVTVSGVAEPAALWDPVSGTARELTTRRDGERLAVDVPFTSVPCALVVFGEHALALPPMPELPSGGSALELTDWSAELLPTLDDGWGDTGLPASPGPSQVWHLEHEVDGTWAPALVTFGPWARAVGPAAPHALPAPGSEPDERWRDVVWSQQRGAVGPGDPKGYLPEEFLALGEAVAGEVVHLRVVVRSDQGTRHLQVGSSCSVEAWWNGAPVRVEQPLYYARGTVSATGADDVLELRFTARADGPVTGSWSLTSARPAPAPEWLTGGPVLVREGCPGGRVQLGSIGRVSLEVDGVEVARHGECDNYTHVAQPRVRRYDLPPGSAVRLLLHEKDSAAVLDGAVLTDSRWTGATPLALLPHDPRWVHLHERVHPLPHAVEVVVGSGRPERFRFQLPPGAQGIRVPEGATVTLPGPVIRQGDEHLFDPVPAGTWCVVELPPSETAKGGGLWHGPVVVTRTGTGSMPLGDWQQLGLQDYSGGVRYRTIAPCEADVLDLGTVRGTAEVRVDGTPVGCRAWSPYTFDVRGLVRAGSVLEVEVFNTLAPHQAAVSSTPWVLPGQTVSGLIGPAALRRDTTQGEP
jgi:hypothetical protein